MIQETRERAVCRKCGVEKPITAFRISGVRYNQEGIGMRYRDNKCKACVGRIERARARLALFEAFGYKCQCCGESHPDFLSLEHIDGKGKSERRRVNGKRATEQEIYFARKNGFDPEIYSLLCMNCNFARGHWGACPHKTGVTPEQAIERLREKAEGTGGRPSKKVVDATLRMFE